MAKFIEVTDVAGTKRLINTRWVQEIWDAEQGTDIYFAFTPPSSFDQDYMRTKENYEEVKMKVWGCNGE